MYVCVRVYPPHSVRLPHSAPPRPALRTRGKDGDVAAQTGSLSRVHDRSPPCVRAWSWTPKHCCRVSVPSRRLCGRVMACMCKYRLEGTHLVCWRACARNRLAVCLTACAIDACAIHACAMDACAMDACAIDACAINACASNAARRAWLGQRWWRSLQRAALRTTRRRRTSQTRMRSSHLPPPPPPLAPPGQAVTARRMDGGGRGVGRAGMRAAARCGGRGKPGARGCSGACSVPGSSPALFTVLLLPPVFPFLLLILIRMPIPIRIRRPTRILLLITYQYQY
jgi:hypothetical protein